MSGTWVLLSWLVSVSLGYGALGGYLGRLVEGYDSSANSSLPALATAVSLTLSLALTLAWARARVRQARDSDLPGRRFFLLGALGAGGGVLATGLSAMGRVSDWYTVSGKNIFLVRPPYKADEALIEWSGSTVQNYRRLGRTEALISDISLGSGSGTGGRQTVEVARQAIDRGINYFDTAPDYSGTDSEYRLGKAMKGVRDQMFLATKFCRPGGHLGADHSVADYIEAVEGSLQRLQTDRVDLVHIHSCDTVDRLMAENAHEAFDRLKAAGKVRFLGVSTHTPNLEAIANQAIESDRFDVLMLAYHHGAWPGIGDIIDRAAAQDIGVVAMKTLRGAMHQGLMQSRAEQDSYTQAAFRWVLSNPSVSGLVISLWESSQLDEFLYASGQPPEPGDQDLLANYAAKVEGEHCRPHCGLCLGHCPEQLAINDILRHRMYFKYYGAQKEAMRLYDGLERKADVCAGCSAPCAQACPESIPIPEHAQEAHRLLTLG
ncbi:MAG: aldo/keto reductase [Myxococcota bacterium]|nr:aldo/keto reductase [Myxococcota bacterium]